MLYINKGVGQGDFKIDSLLTDKKYYIRAWTNWMKNFKNSNSFYEEIEIINSTDVNIKNLFPNYEYKIEVLPEGGSVLEDTENIMAIRWKGGKDVVEKTQIRLLTTKGDTIIDPIKLSSNGFGKFIYKHLPNTDYELHLDIAGDRNIVKELPPAKRQGISLMVNSIHPKNVYIEILTNTGSLPQLVDKPLILNIKGQERAIQKQVYISRLKQSIVLDKNDISKGINYLTLENELGEEVANRHFYNNYIDVEDILNIETNLSSQGDSLEISLNLKQSIEEDFSLSISTLPLNTKAYQPSNSIKSSFSIRPYLQPEQAGVSLITESSDRGQYYEWDAMLLNQNTIRRGKDMFKNPKISLEYEWERGITINGWAKDADLEHETYVWMYSGFIENAFIGDLRRDKTFTTEAILFENDSLVFTIIDDKGRMRKPDIRYELEPKIINQRLDPGELSWLGAKNRLIEDTNWILPFTISDRTIELDEVELIAERVPTKFQITATIEARRVTDEDIKRSPSLLQYLRSLGLYVFMYEGGFVISKYTGHLKNFMPLYVDGMFQSSISFLQIPLSRVQYVYFDPYSNNPFVSVRLKRDEYGGLNESAYLKFPIENGYARPSTYRNPFYSSFTSSFFSYYGTINWKPMLNLINTTPVVFKFPRLDQDEFKLIIEGMGSDGTLISTTKTIKLE